MKRFGSAETSASRKSPRCTEPMFDGYWIGKRYRGVVSGEQQCCSITGYYFFFFFVSFFSFSFKTKKRNNNPTTEPWLDGLGDSSVQFNNLYDTVYTQLQEEGEEKKKLEGALDGTKCNCRNHYLLVIDLIPPFLHFPFFNRESRRPFKFFYSAKRN